MRLFRSKEKRVDELLEICREYHEALEKLGKYKNSLAPQEAQDKKELEKRCDNLRRKIRRRMKVFIKNYPEENYVNFGDITLRYEEDFSYSSLLRTLEIFIGNKKTIVKKGS